MPSSHRRSRSLPLNLSFAKTPRINGNKKSEDPTGGKSSPVSFPLHLQPHPEDDPTENWSDDVFVRVISSLFLLSVREPRLPRVPSSTSTSKKQGWCPSCRAADAVLHAPPLRAGRPPSISSTLLPFSSAGMPRRRRPPSVAAASATCCCMSFLLLVVLLHHHPLAVRPPPPAKPQQQRRLQLQQQARSQTPVPPGRQEDDVLLHSSGSWWIFAAAKGCCKQKAQQASAPSPAEGGTGGMRGGGGPASDDSDAALLNDGHNEGDINLTEEKNSPLQTKERTDTNLPAGGGGGAPPCCGVMPMYFVNSTHTIVLFGWWETLKTWQYAVSVIICVLLGVFSVVLKVVRLRVEQRLASRDARAAAAAAEEVEEEITRREAGRLQAVEGDMTEITGSGKTLSSRSVGKGEQQQVGGKEEGRRLLAKAADVCRRITTGFPLGSNCCRMIQAFILYGFDYLLMLIVMSYNVGVFFAVTGGLALGFFFFGHLLVVSRKNRSSLSSHRQGQQHQHDVEMHDFHAGDPLCCGA